MDAAKLCEFVADNLNIYSHWNRLGTDPTPAAIDSTADFLMEPGTQIQVISTGLPCTGTVLFSTALTILLNSSVYYGGTQTIRGPPSELKLWVRILRVWLEGEKRTVLSLIERCFNGYTAITDISGCQLLPELLKLCLDTKVVCTVCDPFNSVKKISDTLPQREIYSRYITWLEKNIPTDYLIFFDIQEGWEPLCKALGKDISTDILFPYINNSEQIIYTAKYYI
ncbi:hypothetical protein BDV27DRAFT_150737 [Aspergillus caelatus]|uniref:Uncharacterized protein n=1 Tax=Aspergillus caelatus TaxID=61420 RepID=A0A5N6ZM98_9EURO|nr:uncharacterized protein BDV27DRAFT_150737 [Aspergillus caelatus]KAE8358106.1 hypothetical protein BDV27DRAFT_150737 [Aspergillus caelatus]